NRTAINGTEHHRPAKLRCAPWQRPAERHETGFGPCGVRARRLGIAATACTGKRSGNGRRSETETPERREAESPIFQFKGTRRRPDLSGSSSADALRLKFESAGTARSEPNRTGAPRTRSAHVDF